MENSTTSADLAPQYSNIHECKLLSVPADAIITSFNQLSLEELLPQVLQSPHLACVLLQSIPTGPGLS